MFVGDGSREVGVKGLHEVVPLLAGQQHSALEQDGAKVHHCHMTFEGGVKPAQKTTKCSPLRCQL